MSADPLRGKVPVWTPDYVSQFCTICQKPFSLLNRRHHCRRCGDLVCGKCSRGRAEAAFIPTKPQKLISEEVHGLHRACDRCMMQINPALTNSRHSSVSQISPTDDYESEDTDEESEAKAGKDAPVLQQAPPSIGAVSPRPRSGQAPGPVYSNRPQSPRVYPPPKQ